jgi:hypothetical protein
MPASPCNLQRLAPQVVAIQLDEIEDVEEHVGAVPPVADQVEARWVMSSSVSLA